MNGSNAKPCRWSIRSALLLAALGLGVACTQESTRVIVVTADGGCSPDAGELAVVPPEGAAPVKTPLEPAPNADEPPRLPHSPYFTAGAALTLRDLSDPVLLRAFAHIWTVSRDSELAESWPVAELQVGAIPLYRPDSATPVAYELKLESQGVGAGFVVVSIEPGEAPIVSFNTHGSTPVERLFEIAAAAGKNVARIYQLDGVHMVAEDASGALVAAEPARTFAISQPTPGGPPELVPGTAADWPAVKSSYTAAVSAWRAVQTNGYGSTWTQEDQKLDQRALNFAAALGTVRSAASLIPIPVRQFTTVQDDGTYKTVCQVANAAAPFPVSLDDLTPLWNQINGDFVHWASGSNAMCASGCTPMALAIVLGWMDRMGDYGKNPFWSRPDLRRAFFRYKNPVAVSSLTAPLSDDSYLYSSSTPFAWVGQSTSEPGPGTTSAMDMRRFLTELSSAVHTSCSGTEGNTKWWDINGLADWIKTHRVPVQMLTGSNPFGESGFRDNIVDRLQRHGAPGIMHYGGWSGHTIVVVSHHLCDVYKRDGNGNYSPDSTGNHFFYTNFGWGSKSQNRWLNVGNLMMSTVFDPLTFFALQLGHSGKFVQAASSQLGAAAIQGPLPLPQAVLSALFSLEPAGDGSQYIVSGLSNMCLNTGLATAEGTPASFFPCAQGQYQRFEPWMLSNGRYALYHPFSNKCLGVEDGSVDDGARLVLKKCAVVSDASQQFDL